MMKPDNNLVLAIISTVCCCLPIGIYAIVKAAKVDSLYNSGQYEAAAFEASEAKKWSIIAICVGAVIQIIYIAIYGFTIFTQLM